MSIGGSFARRPGSIQRVKATVLALLIGTTGGALFYIADLPLPWMLGSMLATTVFAMVGAKIALPPFIRPPMFAVLGVLLGSGFTTSVAGNMVTWIPTILSLPFYVLIIGGACIAYLRFVNRYDWRTAYFSGTPGGLSEMILMGEQAGGDGRRIALVHCVRVMLIVLFVPFLAEWFVGTSTETAGGASVSEIASPTGQALLLLCAVVGLVVGTKIGLPAAALIGPMILSAAVHLFGIVEGLPPPLIVSVAQVVIGSSIGVRFGDFRFHEVIRTMVVGLGLTGVMFVFAMLLGLAMHLVTGVPVMLIFLAYVPGGLAEMALISFALGLDPAFVTTHHIIRVALVVAIAPFVFRFLEKRYGPGNKPGPPQKK